LRKDAGAVAARVQEMDKAYVQSPPKPLPNQPAPGKTALHNPEIAAALDEVADILEIENANQFRVRAYRNASRIVSSFPEEIAGLLNRGGTLKGIRGIGADLAGKIEDLALTGSTQLLRQLRTELPPALTELLRLPNLGPKRVDILHKALGVETIEQLHDALKNDRVATLPRFGKKLASKLLEAVENLSRTQQRLKRAVAAQYAEPLIAWLAALPGVEAAIVAGSYRRARDTVGDLDVVATAKDTKSVIEGFSRYPEIVYIVAKGSTRATGLLRSGLQVDVRAVPPESYGAALVYFTGSKAHNIAIRAIARDRGLKINEYGVFRASRRIAGRTEAEVYAAIGLRSIDPELREHQGEIEAACAGTLPRLVEAGHIRGDLHMHTRATDGRNTLPEMVDAARSKGYEYIAVTDHSKHLTVARGFDAARLRKQMREIDELNAATPGMRILKAIELDILEDGTLDLPDEVLSELDLVVAAVHYAFDLSRSEQTKRILRALENPHVTILAHPSGRLIDEREPCDLDMEQILRKAREVGCFVELNAQPDRLDLIDAHCRRAKELGVLVSIATDAHSAAELDFMKHGIGQARRGWLERTDILNTRSYAELAVLLARRSRT
jgi:DNA polymerase (family 10)